MDSEYIFCHYSKILDEIIDKYDFFKLYFQNPTSLEDDIISEYTPNWREDISIYFGLTRGCIIDEFYNYVVKFDLCARFNENNCAKEQNIYIHAKDEGLDEYFAECVFLGNYTRSINYYKCKDYFTTFEEPHSCYSEPMEEIVINIPLYAYPKVEGENYFHVPREKIEEIMSYIQEHSYSPIAERSRQIGAYFIYLYGEKEYEKLSDFCDRMRINDLHRGNVIIKNNKMTIIDYAGFGI